MIEQFLTVLTRLAVALETIAANSVPRQISTETIAKAVEASYGEAEEKPAKEIPVEGEDVIDTEPKVAEKTKRKPRTEKVKEEKAEEVDYADLRKQLAALDDDIAEDGSDKVNDELEALYDSYDAQTISEIKDSDLVEVLAEVTKLKDKYFE